MLQTLNTDRYSALGRFAGSHRPSGQIEVARDRNGRPSGMQLGRAQETAHGPVCSARCICRQPHYRLGVFLCRRVEWRRHNIYSRTPAQDRRARTHTSPGSGRSDVRQALRLLP